MMNKLILPKIIEEYSFMELLKAFLVGALFFTITAAIYVIPLISIGQLYVPYMEYFLIFGLLGLSLSSVYFNKLFIETLQTYKIVESIEYNVFKVRSSTILTAVFFVITLLTYLVLH